MALKTLADLRTDVRNRADLHEDGGAIQLSELDNYINQGYSELYDLMIQADDARTFTKNATVPIPVGPFSFRLPNDFYRLVSLHVRRGGGWELAQRADSSEYAELADNTQTPQLNIPKYFTRWHPATGERFVFVFPEQKPEDVAITYFPQPPRLEVEGDSVDNPADWLNFVTLTAAISCMVKIERDPQALIFEKKEAAKRIKKAVAGLDMAHPFKVRRTRSRSRLPGYWH